MSIAVFLATGAAPPTPNTSPQETEMEKSLQPANGHDAQVKCGVESFSKPKDDLVTAAQAPRCCLAIRFKRKLFDLLYAPLAGPPASRHPHTFISPSHFYAIPSHHAPRRQP